MNSINKLTFISLNCSRMPTKKKPKKLSKCNTLQSKRPFKKRLAGNVGCNEGSTGWVDYYNSSKGMYHGVPKTSLHNRIKGKVIHGVKPGPKQYLSVEEETELAEFAIEAASVGCGQTRK